MTFAGIGVALAAATLTLAPIGAHAQGAGVVVFEGATGPLNPPVPLLGGTGTFTFSTATAGPPPGVCVYAGADGDEFPNPDDSGLCVIAASGTYSNIVCGTGSASGSGSVTPAAGLPVNGETITISAFGITFVGGQGLLTGSASDPDAGAGTAAGYVGIAPTTGNCVTGVSSFSAAGVDAVVAP